MSKKIPRKLLKDITILQENGRRSEGVEERAVLM